MHERVGGMGALQQGLLRSLRCPALHMDQLVCIEEIKCVFLPLQENQENASDLVISDTELKQVAYVFKCTNSTLQIKGKINSITLGKWRSPEKCCCRELV